MSSEGVQSPALEARLIAASASVVDIPPKSSVVEYSYLMEGMAIMSVEDGATRTTFFTGSQLLEHKKLFS